MAQITLNSSGVASSGTLALQSNGTTTAVTIDASQNVGIGTTSPTRKLDVATAGTSYIRASNTTNSVNVDMYATTASGAIGTQSNHAFDFLTNNSVVGRFDTSGNLGIGTTSPAAKLEVNGLIFVNDTANTSGRFLIRNSTTGANAGGYDVRQIGVDTSISNVSNGYMSFSTNNTEAARIDSSGNFLVNTTSALGGKISVVFDGSTGNGIRVKTSYATTGSQFIDFLNSGGTQIGYISQNGASTVNYSTSSDYRLKNTITPMTGALAKVALLKPVTYKWNADGSDGQGFIAHELAEVVPDCVSGAKDAVETYTDEDGNEATRPVYQGIDTSFLVATLTAAIQEQQALITQLQADVAALKA